VFSCFILCLVPPIFIAVYVLGLATKKIEASKLKGYAQAGARVDQTLTFLRTVKSLNGEEHEIELYAAETGAARKTAVKFGFVGAAAMGFFIMMIFVVYGVAFLIGSRMISQQWRNSNSGKNYQVGDVLTIFFAIITGLMGLSSIAPQFKEIEAGKIAIAEVRKIIETDDEEKSGSYVPAHYKGKIEFRNVTFAYPQNPDKPVLQGLSFVIYPGEKVGLVGPSGCGKSTVIQLIERFYDPQEG